MLQRVEPLSITDFDKGLYTNLNILNNEKGQSPNCMDVKWNADGSIQKRLGANTTNAVAVGSAGAAGWTLDNTTGGLSTELQAFWKLNETAGGRSDEFGGNNLTDVNATLFSSGIRGNAALHNVANSQVLYEATTGPIQTGATDFSISAWFYLNSTSPTVERTIVSKRDPPVDSLTHLLLHCDGADASTTFTDSSSQAHSVTAQGNAQVDTAQQKFGTGSALFDGTGDYLSIPDSNSWNLGTGDFTIEMFFRINAKVASGAIFESGLATIDGIRISPTDGVDRWEIIINGASQVIAQVLNDNQWYHMALTRSSGTCRLFVDGTQVGSSFSNTADVTSGTTGVSIGANSVDLGPSLFFNGWLDEIRVSKGIARYTANFTAPEFAFSQKDFEYWLYVNTDQFVTFKVSSSGLAANATVRATSLGAVSTGTWYHVVAFHSDGTHIAVTGNSLLATTTLYTAGVRIGSAPFVIGGLSDGLPGKPSFWMDGRIDEVGFWKKILVQQNRSDLYGGGTGNTYSKGSSGFGWAMYDFGASSIRWVTVAAGTGIYASSNMGVTYVSVATTRSQNYQYFERSRNVLIATSDSFDVPMYWAGSVGTFFATLAPLSAPSVKYSVNHQGFLILLNSSTRRRGFFYQDDNTQLTSAWPNSFDLPSSADDEITAAFTLDKTLYVSTRYKIFRVSYVGGNPDWQYEVKRDWGFVPRTVKKISIESEEFAIGMDWGRHIRIFDGSKDTIISTNIEDDNGMCDFAMEKISYSGSGLIVTHAEVDPLEYEYRMNVGIGLDSNQTTHAIVLNGRSLAFYPYANQPYQAMCVAESGGRQYLLAVDRSGYTYILNTGNLDVTTTINDNYDSPFLFRETPAVSQKSQKIDLYFKQDSSGIVYYNDRADLSSVWSSMPKRISITRNKSTIGVVESIDLPATQNIYQFQLTSSSGTANPWRLTHVDFLQSALGYGVPNA